MSVDNNKVTISDLAGKWGPDSLVGKEFAAAQEANSTKSKILITVVITILSIAAFAIIGKFAAAVAHAAKTQVDRAVLMLVVLGQGTMVGLGVSAMVHKYHKEREKRMKKEGLSPEQIAEQKKAEEDDMKRIRAATFATRENIFNQRTIALVQESVQARQIMGALEIEEQANELAYHKVEQRSKRFNENQ